MLVDDNQLAAEALERWLVTIPGMRWIGWAADGTSALTMVGARSPDVLLLDVEIPGTDTFALLRQLTNEKPQLRVVMFSAYVRAEYIDRALGDGAAVSGAPHGSRSATRVQKVSARSGKPKCPSASSRSRAVSRRPDSRSTRRRKTLAVLSGRSPEGSSWCAVTAWPPSSSTM